MQEFLFNQLESPLAPYFLFDGKKYLYFGGTAYLGIPQNDEFFKNYLKGVKKFGLNNGTSRGNNVQLGIYNDAEKFAANKFGSQDSLITSSGYLAAQMTVKSLSSLGEVRYAPATHPALWITESQKITGTFTNWANKLVNEINQSELTNWVLISNSMNNLFPEIYDFSFLKKITKEKQIILIVDDSHGIGINNNGLSALSSIPLYENVEVVLVASMAKALGVDAGIILGSGKIINQLKQTSEFLGASPPSAAGLFAFMKGDDIYKSEIIKLKDNVSTVAKIIKDNENWHFAEGFPVFFSKNKEIKERLFDQNIVISSFPYPDKDSEIINRIVISSRHSKTDLQKLISSI